ncbi:hypothetical protein QAD02_006277 [Eretmocerus hayati]|uniref:Uncharacterized protein n=1 Tax=Eretmocerus hayati TaxID=131215 RepID=A0ACC2N0H3_9HYME|nr:hypothetical protein QAD02_006277 [Eretmocerus hayati]
MIRYLALSVILLYAEICQSTVLPKLPELLNLTVIRPRITNNVYAGQGEFPAQISLQIDGWHTCGGSLIGKRHVLTAAHCVYDFVQLKKELFRVKIVAGRTNLMQGGGQKLSVDRIAFHPEYRQVYSTFIADIAVIRLKTPIKETDDVKVIGLPEPGAEFPIGTSLIVSGFGADTFGGPPSPYLKKMTMFAVDSGTCQQLWQGSLIHPGHLCAVFGPGYGVCQGDSGGSLTLDKKIIVGIVSAGRGRQCGAGYPDLFTKVSYFMDFIKSELLLPHN